MEVNSKSIIKSNKISTTEEVSNQIKNILDLEKEIKDITGSLNDKAEDISNYSNRGFFSKIINSKEIKWENHAVDVYKGIDLNLKLNKNNTIVIISIFKLLVEQEKKIKENLNSINQITKNTDKHLKDYKIKLEKLNSFQEEIKKEKEASIEQVNQIIEKLDQGDQVSRELADILVNRFSPVINENVKMNKSNSNEIQNAQEKLKGIDEYILELKKENLELHYEINNLKENNSNLQESITSIKEIQNKFEEKNNFFKKLCIFNIILLPIAILGMSYFLKN